MKAGDFVTFTEYAGIGHSGYNYGYFAKIKKVDKSDNTLLVNVVKTNLSEDSLFWLIADQCHICHAIVS